MARSSRFLPLLGLILTVASSPAQPGAQNAAPLIPAQLVPLDSLAGFRPPVPECWQIGGGIAGDPRIEKTLELSPGTGILASITRPGVRANNIFTTWEHGDLELDLDFLMPVGSNSGVFLQGRYEVQLYDSWAVPAAKMKVADNGSIYERYDESRPEGKKGYEGHPPTVNASRAPGLWQHLRVEFEAPRFDAEGKKTRHARFRRVFLNGFQIHENVEVTGPTRTARFDTEALKGPIVIQGNHGPVAYRDIRIKHLATEHVGLESLGYKVYAGDFKKVGEYDGQKPFREGAAERVSRTAVDESGRMTVVFTGTLTVPRDGDYAFSANSGGSARLKVDDRTVVVPLESGAFPGTMALKAGKHAFRLDSLPGDASQGRTTLGWSIEGPGISRQSLTDGEGGRGGGGGGGGGGRGRRGGSTPVDVGDDVVIQRSFAPFEPRSRFYGINVGTPAGAHFTYDFETGALLRVWRGDFLDASGMWENRGNGQVGRPRGPALTFDGKPFMAIMQGGGGDWPAQVSPMYSSQGYKIDAAGLPTFRCRLAEVSLEDRIAPLPEAKGVTRTLKANGSFTKWTTWLLLAEAEMITPQPGGRGWVIGDRAWYLDWPAQSDATPVVRAQNGHQELVLPLTSALLDVPITYSIIW